MDKIKINNQVVIMRKFVKQAKVHVINKLVKQVKLLQNRKGNEAQVEKCKRKAERYLEEITLLKSIKPDSVSKLALSKARDWGEILQQKTSTLDERCLAMLASYGAVQKEVESFHFSNPYLVTKIPSLLKEWEEKSKFPKNSPFDKRKAKLDTNNILSNAFEKSFDKEVSPSSLKKFKVGIHEELDKVEKDIDVMQQDISDEDQEQKSENLSKSNNQSLRLPNNFESDKVSDELVSDNDVIQEDKECKGANVMKGKNDTNQKIKNTFIYNELQSKTSPVKFPENVKSDNSSDEDLNDNNSTQEEIPNEEEYKLKRVKKNKNQNQKKIKHELISNKFQNKNHLIKSSKTVDRELCSDVESSVNDVDEEDNKKNISESDSSENINGNNAVEIRSKCNKNYADKLKSDDKGSFFFLRADKKRKLLENQNFCAKGMAGKEYDGKMLDKQITPKEIQSGLSIHDCKNIKKSNLKTISMLNLDDLQGLDEIPVEEKTEDGENSDEEKEKFPANEKQNDFFLRGDELDPAVEDRVNVYSKNAKRPKFLRNRESNFKEKSFLKTSQFSKRESYKFNNETNFKRGSIESSNSADRFQHKGKREFQNKDERVLNRKQRRALQSTNQGDLYPKGKTDFQSRCQESFVRKGKNGFQGFGKKSYDEQARKSNFKNDGISSFRKDRMPYIKGNAISSKPLHPSWEAKRKQKELTQTQFQGKKIVFND